MGLTLWTQTTPAKKNNKKAGYKASVRFANQAFAVIKRTDTELIGKKNVRKQKKKKKLRGFVLRVACLGGVVTPCSFFFGGGGEGAREGQRERESPSGCILLFD